MKKTNWIYKVFLLTFLLSLVFSGATNIVANKFSSIILIPILMVVLLIGIIFDMIGVAVLQAKESHFHAMASNRVYGSKEAIKLLKNSSVVASICNDVVGDVCGIVSGGLGAVLALSISANANFNVTLSGVIVAAIISSLTVGGKAIGKNIALKKCNNIVFTVGKIKRFLKLK